jgi:hypothetical protein
MKKIILIFVSILFLTSCNSSLSKIKEREIINNYIKETNDGFNNVDNPEIIKYLGTYNGAVCGIITANNNYLNHKKVVIVGEEIIKIDNKPIFIYYRREFYSLEKAYAYDVLDKEDVLKIIELYNEWYFEEYGDRT